MIMLWGLSINELYMVVMVCYCLVCMLFVHFVYLCNTNDCLAISKVCPLVIFFCVRGNCRSFFFFLNCRHISLLLRLVSKNKLEIYATFK